MDFKYSKSWLPMIIIKPRKLQSVKLETPDAAFTPFSSTTNKRVPTKALCTPQPQPNQNDNQQNLTIRSYPILFFCKYKVASLITRWNFLYFSGLSTNDVQLRFWSLLAGIFKILAKHVDKPNNAHFICKIKSNFRPTYSFLVSIIVFRTWMKT